MNVEGADEERRTQPPGWVTSLAMGDLGTLPNNPVATSEESIRAIGQPTLDTVLGQTNEL